MRLNTGLHLECADLLNARITSRLTLILFLRLIGVKPGTICVHERAPCAGRDRVVFFSLFPVFVGACGTMRARYCFTFATGLVECLCFAGAVFGWASLVFVLKTEGFFSTLCVNTTGVNSTHVLGKFRLLDSAASRHLCTLTLSEISV